MSQVTNIACDHNGVLHGVRLQQVSYYTFHLIFRLREGEIIFKKERLPRETKKKPRSS